jgi:hypothetical protein
MPKYHGDLSLNGTLRASGIEVAGVNIVHEVDVSKTEIESIRSSISDLPSKETFQMLSTAVSNVIGLQNAIIPDVANLQVKVTSLTSELSSKAPTNNATLNGTTTIAGGRICAMGGSDGTTNGFYMWNTTDANWLIHTTGSNSGGQSPGFDFSGPAIRFRVARNSNAGWIWENADNITVASLNSLSGNLTLKGSAYAKSFIIASDERLKTENVIINDGLEVLRLLKPQHYRKSSSIECCVDMSYEVGLIAQDVIKIAKLQHTVKKVCVPKPPDPNLSMKDMCVEHDCSEQESDNDMPGTLHVQYNDIHCYTIAAVIELDAIVKAQQQVIGTLLWSEVTRS